MEEARWKWGVFLVMMVGRCWGELGGGDIVGLNEFKASADPVGVLDSKWNATINLCKWEGVKGCMKGRVTKLVVEYSGLNGTFADKTLSRLGELRVLSLKGNGLTGTIPDLSGLHNLKSLFLDQNRFTGPFPESIANLHRLVVIVVSDNQLTGAIPESIAGLQKLHIFRLENNRFNASLPAFNQSDLSDFNVSNNQLSGPIPPTVVLFAFNSSSYAGNPGLCGGPLQPCNSSAHPPASSPASAAVVRETSHGLSGGQIAGIVGGSLVGLAALLVLIYLLILMRRKKGGKEGETENPSKEDGEHAGEQKEGPPLLVYCGRETQMYTLEDLLRASAEIMGRGTIGATYKAVMGSGLTVTVKRLKSSKVIGREEFEGHMEALGKLRHPNIVPLRAYFQAKEDRLLVYDYQPNGSLFSLIQGKKAGGGKALHWSLCLKIAEEVGMGLAYLHQASPLFHGNLKSSNILLGRDLEACITDFGLTVFEAEEDPEQAVAYKAPECCKSIKKAGPKSDIFSFGVLILELLTGNTPPLLSFIHWPATDLQKWVRSVREESFAPALDDSSEDEDEGESESEEKVAIVVNIALACVSLSPEKRPSMKAVLRMIEDAHHSPRWSENVHSSRPDSASEGSSFTGLERD